MASKKYVVLHTGIGAGVAGPAFTKGDVVDGDKLGDVQRLLRHKAIREATPVEAVHAKIDLRDVDRPAASYQQLLAEKDREIALHKSRIAELEREVADLRSTANAGSGGAPGADETPAMKLLEEKDKVIAELQQQVAALSKKNK